MIKLRDGLYQVHRHEVTGGFELRNGKVVACAPVLRKRFEYWSQFAVWVGPNTGENDEQTIRDDDTGQP